MLGDVHASARDRAAVSLRRDDGLLLLLSSLNQNHLLAMPPKSPKKAGGQPTLSSFFGAKPPTPSPVKKSVDKGKGRAAPPDVIELLDSDDDGTDNARPTAASSRIETDEQMARRLAAEEEHLHGSSNIGGKRKFEQIDLELDSARAGPSSSTERSGLAAPSSSSKTAPPAKKAFTKSGPGPASSSHVSVIPDLDTDPLLFRPEEVDVAGWPAGRVPYAFIVRAGFVPVAATRKRLAIVRILTK